MRPGLSGVQREAWKNLDAELVRDHLTGLELQLVEFVERQQRAAVQGDTDEMERLQAEIEELQADLAVTAEVVSARCCFREGGTRPSERNRRSSR